MQREYYPCIQCICEAPERHRISEKFEPDRLARAHPIHLTVQDVATVTCPYCFERIELYIDPDTSGEMVHDCDVCCRPWTVAVSRNDDGSLLVTVTRAQ